ncbi:hypothetical protein Droror1_Dr00018958 [Drosera rotundifolia]
MGLHSQLNDIVSSDSIPLLLLSLVASLLAHLRSLFPSSDNYSPPQSSSLFSDDDDTDDHSDDDDVGDERPPRCCGDECVVCLSKMRKGERIRSLDCRHVFHARCLDGWLRHLNFTCPLCRSPIEPDYCKRVRSEMRVDRGGGRLVGWFGNF